MHRNVPHALFYAGHDSSPTAS